MKIDWQALPPAEALEYFRAKGYRIGFDWREVWGEEHATAFTVAKAMRLDLLQDIRRVLDQAIAEGRTLDWFKKNLTPILQEKGWWGRQEMVDPQTGLPQNVQLGSPRRLRIIYDTNLRAAHAAGRWQQIQRSKRHRPYLRYAAVLDGRTRPQHRAWHGTIRPVDDSFWGSHYPPNGWRCRCTVIQLSAAQMAARGWDASDPPDIEMRDYVNGRTGEVTRVPVGIDPGFAHNPGQQRMAMLSPPPANRPLVMPYAGAPAAAEVPAPRPMTQPVLPPGLPDDAYVDAFLSSFGASADQPALFRDALGDPLVVSRRFFETANGRLKLRKEGREQYAAVLAEAIRDPDEIWHVWVRQPDGTMGLRKRYLRWPAGDGAPLIAVVEVGRDGWVGVTAFNPAQADYLNRQRVGTLAYRRP